MLRFKEHLPIGQDDQYRRQSDDDGFHALRLGGHGDLLLHGVDKEMKNDARQHANVI